MSGRRQSHLVRRGAVYYGRFPVPRDLLNRVQKTELTWSTRLRSANQAKVRVAKWTGAVRDFFAYIRDMPNLSDQDIRNLLRDFYRSLIEAQPAANILPQKNEEAHAASIDYQQDASTQEIFHLESLFGADTPDRKVLGRLTKFLTSQDVVFGNLTPTDQARLMEGAIRAFIEDEKRCMHGLRTQIDPYEPEDVLFSPERAGSQLTHQNSVSPINSTKTLGQAVEEYNSERKASARIRDTTLREQYRALQWLVDYFGAQQVLSQLTPDHIREFRAKMRTVRKGGGAGENFQKLIGACEKDRPSTKTLHKTSCYQAAFLREMADADHCSEKLAKFAVIQVAPEDTKNDKRPFTDDELIKIFSYPIFDHALNRSPPRKMREKRPKEFGWYLLLLAYTAGRSGEIVQMQIDQIDLDAPLPYLRIRGTLKTEQSERDVPIHPELLELGFADFVRAQRIKHGPTDRLFPNIPMTGGNGLSGTTSKWGRLLMKNSGVGLGEVSLHTFRHRLVGDLRNAGYGDEFIRPIIGHSDASKTITQRYGGNMNLQRKLDTLKSISFIELIEKTLKKPSEK